ncbi:hypothetical protein C8035_v010522 [Colletotrichum spinosum]|uniref:C3H1-type domain-containing protein n=1 Tax=Colletotrichum spinosum TaxID=1347390 RepID=A0A4R8PP72_9PEZI|nr:hypothetical protein C8035_v010522 [Colletotrichum spinosum]
METTLNNSSSDHSCSPPASRSSTRDTTPEFDLSTAVATGITGMRICGMETPGSFQTRNLRQSSDMPPSAFRRFTLQQQQQQQQQHNHNHDQDHHVQQQVPMRHVLPNPIITPRSIETANWRMGMGMAGAPHGHYHTPSSASGPEYVDMVAPVHPAAVSDPVREGTGVDTTGFYAYCLDRGNGNYTRLIPADSLPPLVGIPAVQNRAEGLFVLPTPRGLDSQISSGGAIQPVTFKKRIDHIVASCPVPPKKPKVYCDKWVHEGVCAFTQQGCKYKHEMPLDKATQHSLGLFHGLPTWWKKQQAELQRQQQQQQRLREGGGPEAFFDVCQSQQDTVPSPARSEKDHTSPARASQSWRRADEVRVQGQIDSVATVRQSGGGGGGSGYRSSAQPRSAYQQTVDSPTSPCVWGPIGPPSKQTSDHPRMYHPVFGGYGGSNNLIMLSPPDESLMERGSSSRFNSFAGDD